MKSLRLEPAERGGSAEGAVGLLPYTGSPSTKYNIYPTGTLGNNLVEGGAAVGTKTAGYYGLTAFSKPAAIWDEFRPLRAGIRYKLLRQRPAWSAHLEP